MPNGALRQAGRHWMQQLARSASLQGFPFVMHAERAQHAGQQLGRTSSV